MNKKTKEATIASLCFDRGYHKKTAKTEHERAVDACIPEAVDIANRKLKKIFSKQELPKNPADLRLLATIYFLEAMDEITERKGLRVLPREYPKKLLFRRFNSVVQPSPVEKLREVLSRKF